MKRGALLLNSLDGCGRCGVERRFRLLAGKLCCEACSLPLDEARTAKPIGPPSTDLIDPFPPRPDADTRPNDGTESTPAGTSSHSYGDPW